MLHLCEAHTGGLHADTWNHTYLPWMVSSTLTPCWRVPCSSSCFLLFLLLHSDEIKPGWDPCMLTVHLR